VDLYLESKVMGRASVPSGASTGKYEALELRDGKKDQYLGKGVLNAVKNINTIISKSLIGEDVLDQKKIDQTLINLDGTKDKSLLGANSILGVSMAAAHAGAGFKNIPLYKYLSDEDCNLMPMPMMNILNGGSHADNSVDIQEFMIMPFGANSFTEALQIGAEIFHYLKDVLKKKGLTTSVGDEGGFAPNLRSNEEALEVIQEGIYKAGLKSGKDVFFALDVAASELFEDGKYNLFSERKSLNSQEMVDYLKSLVKRYPIVSIEDGLDENDWNGWALLTKELGSNIQIVGDDLTVTNINRLKKAISEKSINSILIKLNQIGTVSETLETIKMAKKSNFGAIISHRSGETEDTSIADLSVAMGMGQIKTGSVSRTDRICKYNQLLRIEETLGKDARFPGIEILKINR
jgi:enolase